MKVYTARQAIYNRKQNVVAYELLFRDGPENFFPEVETNSATSKLLLDSHFNQGLDKAIIKPLAKTYRKLPDQILRCDLPSVSLR